MDTRNRSCKGSRDQTIRMYCTEQALSPPFLDLGSSGSFAFQCRLQPDVPWRYDLSTFATAVRDTIKPCATRPTSENQLESGREHDSRFFCRCLEPRGKAFEDCSERLRLLTSGPSDALEDFRVEEL